MKFLCELIQVTNLAENKPSKELTSKGATGGIEEEWSLSWMSLGIRLVQLKLILELWSDYLYKVNNVKKYTKYPKKNIFFGASDVLSLRLS